MPSSYEVIFSAGNRGHTTLFFAAELADGPRGELGQARPPELVTVMQHAAKAPGQQP